MDNETQARLLALALIVADLRLTVENLMAENTRLKQEADDGVPDGE